MHVRSSHSKLGGRWEPGPQHPAPCLARRVLSQLHDGSWHGEPVVSEQDAVSPPTSLHCQRLLIMVSKGQAVNTGPHDVAHFGAQCPALRCFIYSLVTCGQLSLYDRTSPHSV